MGFGLFGRKFDLKKECLAHFDSSKVRRAYKGWYTIAQASTNHSPSYHAEMHTSHRRILQSVLAEKDLVAVVEKNLKSRQISPKVAKSLVLGVHSELVGRLHDAMLIANATGSNNPMWKQEVPLLSRLNDIQLGRSRELNTRDFPQVQLSAHIEEKGRAFRLSNSKNGWRLTVLDDPGAIFRVRT